MVKMEAKRYGVPVLGSEVIGTVPMKALLDCAEYYFTNWKVWYKSNLRKETSWLIINYLLIIN